jgi:hypothetical protein
MFLHDPRLLWLTVAVALGVGWGINYSRMNSAIVRLEAILRTETALRNSAEEIRDALHKRLVFEQQERMKERLKQQSERR